MSSTSHEPLILVCSLPLSGHVIPILSLVNGLTDDGYEVTMVTGSEFEQKVRECGADFVSLEGNADFNDNTMDELVPGRKDMAPSFDRTVLDVENMIVATVTEQFAAIQRALENLSKSGRPVVLITDVLFFGAHPISLGAPGLKPVGWICLGILPILMSRNNNLGLDNDTSSEHHANKLNVISGFEQKFFINASARHKAICKDLGCKEEPKFMWEHSYITADRILQLCPPSLEFERESLPSNFRFAGSTPKHRAQFTPPSWWGDVLRAKRVIMVTQGTFAVSYKDLIVPTFEALKDEPDTLTVAILGRRGAKLEDDVIVPENARVIDYLHYDALLPYVDAFVYNGGYGGLLHSLSHSVPVIIAGDSEDKPIVAIRAEAAGVAINLKTGQPNVKQIKEAVNTVIGNPKFHEALKKIRIELEAHNSLAILEESIMEIVNRGSSLLTKSDEESEDLLVKKPALPVYST